MPSIGPGKLYVPVDIGSAYTDAEYFGWTNDDEESQKYTVNAVTLLAGSTISANTYSYWSLAIHGVTSAGAHTTSIATLSFALAGGSNLEPYEPMDFTLSTTAANLVIDEGQGFNVYLAKSGTASNLPVDARVVVHLREGEGAAQ